MVLVFHEMGHNPAGIEAGASVGVFLRDGLKSKQILREEGKISSIENPYYRAIAKREEWIEERKEALKDNPTVLQSVLSTGYPISGHDIFHKTGHPANREENIFFGFSEKPSSNRDWVAVEVPDTSTLHDASCRDRGDPAAWVNTGVTIQEYRRLKGQGQMPHGWQSHYNEHLVKDIVPAHRIISYAKVEKELPVDAEISAAQLNTIKSFINHNLGDVTQFGTPEDNVLLHETSGMHQIRVSLNKEKVTGKEDEVAVFFAQFNSMKALLKAAQEHATPTQTDLKTAPPIKGENISTGYNVQSTGQKYPPPTTPQKLSQLSNERTLEHP